MALGSFGVSLGMAYWADKQLQEKIAEQRAEQEQRERLALVQQRENEEKDRQSKLREEILRQEKASRAAAQNRIDNAFEDQYIPPPECRNPQSDTQWVKCVDLKRAARNQFRTQHIELDSRQQDIKIGREQ